jgi:hypothetical protein
VVKSSWTPWIVAEYKERWEVFKRVLEEECTSESVGNFMEFFYKGDQSDEAEQKF